MEMDTRMQLNELLIPETISLHVRVIDPMSVVQAAGALLVASGGAEERYIDAMQQSLRTNGPYMVIVPGVALLHARPQDGARRLCMSLVTLDPPIAFGNEDNDPVHLAFAFGAIDQQEHLEALSSLARFLADQEALAVVRSSSSIEEIMTIFSTFSTRSI